MVAIKTATERKWVLLLNSIIITFSTPYKYPLGLSSTKGNNLSVVVVYPLSKAISRLKKIELA